MLLRGFSGFIQPALLAFCLTGLLFGYSPTHAERPATQYLQPQTEQPTVSRDISLMTTRVVFSIVLDQASLHSTSSDKNKARAEKAIDQAIKEFQRIEAVMSEWRPDSEVSRINRNAGGDAVEISFELFRLLQAARQISELSDGAFDVSFRSAGTLWDFRKATVPKPEQIQQAIQHIDYRRLELVPPALDSEAGGQGKLPKARISHPNTSIGLGAIAKGYAVDRAAQLFRQAGFDAFSINAGGDLYVAGRKGEQLWKVGIQHPRERDRLLANLPASNLAVATSGDYERFFIHNGQRYSHIINPHTGYPANGCQSVTIMAERAFWADALATAVFVIGPSKGLALVENMDGVETLIVDDQGKVRMSSGFSPEPKPDAVQTPTVVAD